MDGVGSLFGSETLIRLLGDIAARVRSGETRSDAYYVECPGCLNCGWTEVWRTRDGKQVKGVIRCKQCNFWTRKGESE